MKVELLGDGSMVDQTFSSTLKVKIILTIFILTGAFFTEKSSTVSGRYYNINFSKEVLCDTSTLQPYNYETGREVCVNQN